MAGWLKSLTNVEKPIKTLTLTQMQTMASIAIDRWIVLSSTRVEWQGGFWYLMGMFSYMAWGHMYSQHTPAPAYCRVCKSLQVAARGDTCPACKRDAN